MSGCDASHGASSAGDPVSTLTTPPGTSEVASTSARLIAESGKRCDATTTTELPGTSAGAIAETRPTSAVSCGAMTADDAGRLGHRDVEVRTRDRVAVAGDLAELVAPSRVPDPAVDRLVDLGGGGGRRGSGLLDDLVDELRLAALEDLGDAVEHLTAVVGGRARPALHRAARGARRHPVRLCAKPARRWRGSRPC